MAAYLFEFRSFNTITLMGLNFTIVFCDYFAMFEFDTVVPKIILAIITPCAGTGGVPTKNLIRINFLTVLRIVQRSFGDV
jgi:hypothetical protein